MKVFIQTVSGKRYAEDLPEAIQASTLREHVARVTGLRHGKLKVIYKGKTVAVSDELLHLSEADTILAFVNRTAAAAIPGDREDDVDVLEDSTPVMSARAKRLHRKLCIEWHMPDWLFMILVAVPTKVWLIGIAWIAGAPLASMLHLGPIYILGTLILVIFMNLGTRQAGEASAYSIFNNFQELPGQLNANTLDDQMRRGQM